jgi:putative addiction module killer protein
MYIIKQTIYFSKWISKLKDIKGKVSIIRRVDRMKMGNFGDYKFVGSDVYELKIATGPGYRVYYRKRGSDIIILLVAGDKSTQNSDISKAQDLAKEYKDG